MRLTEAAAPLPGSISERWAQMMGLPGATTAGAAGGVPSATAGGRYKDSTNSRILLLKLIIVLCSTCECSLTDWARE